MFRRWGGSHGSERRASLRLAESDEIHLFSDGRSIGRAQLIEQSAGGLRLKGMPDLIAAADKVLSMRTGRAYEVDVVWAVGFEVGLRVRRVRRLWGAFAEPDFEPLRAKWLQGAHDQPGRGGAVDHTTGVPPSRNSLPGSL